MADESRDIDFCTELRDKTKLIHDQSDKLINLKLLVVLTDKELYGKVIGDFYHVFLGIENAIRENADNMNLQPFCKTDLLRADAFEKDLVYYLGQDWKNKLDISEPVRMYCDRLTQVSKEDPDLLLAYGHSMYLALLAGGQILRRIVKKTLGIPGPEGLAVFDFPDDVNKTELRRHITEGMNALSLSRDVKDAIIAEKFRVFQMNNAIAESVKPQVKHYRRIIKFVLLVLLLLFATIYLFVYLRSL